MSCKSSLFLLIFFGLFAFMTHTLEAQEIHDLEGKWDLVISKDGKELPSWLEVKVSGVNTLVGQFVYAMGSARPISEINMNDGKFSFTIPRQWEPEGVDMSFVGSIKNDKLEGTMIYTDAKMYSWKGNRAPKQKYIENPKWGKAINVFNGKDLDGWHTEGDNQWVVESGILKSPKSGSNLISDQKFMNYKLHAEFRYPKGSNSGIYLRGRYEVQIADNKGSDPSNILFGGIYGFLTPNQMAAKGPGEWQTYDITLNGNRVSIIANGKPIIADQLIPGITGGALNSREGEAESFFIQGDHGPVEFKSFIVTPMME